MTKVCQVAVVEASQAATVMPYVTENLKIAEELPLEIVKLLRKVPLVIDSWMFDGTSSTNKVPQIDNSKLNEPKTR